MTTNQQARLEYLLSFRNPTRLQRDELNSLLLARDTGLQTTPASNRYGAAWVPGIVKSWLEGCPPEPGPFASNLRGFIINDHFFCWHCCGRLSARGILLPGDASPAWNDLNPERQCSACGRLR